MEPVIKESGPTTSTKAVNQPLGGFMVTQSVSVWNKRSNPFPNIQPTTPNTQTQPKLAGSAMCDLLCDADIAIMTLSLKLRRGCKTTIVRAVVDPGSQNSYITQNQVLDLGLVSTRESCDVQNILFGGGSIHMTRNAYNVKVESLDGGFSMWMDVLDTDCIGGGAVIPRVRVGCWMAELIGRGIYFTDLGEDAPQFELLIGSDYFGQLILGQQTRQLRAGPVAIQTRFGWTLAGKWKKGGWTRV